MRHKLLLIWFALITGLVLLTFTQFHELRSKLPTTIWPGFTTSSKSTPVMTLVDEGNSKQDQPNAVIVMLVAPPRLKRTMITTLLFWRSQ